MAVPETLRGALTEEAWSLVEELLSLDPRPAYHEDPNRVYGMEFQGMEIQFTVSDSVLSVVKVFRSQ